MDRLLALYLLGSGVGALLGIAGAAAAAQCAIKCAQNLLPGQENQAVNTAGPHRLGHAALAGPALR